MNNPAPEPLAPLKVALLEESAFHCPFICLWCEPAVENRWETARVDGEECENEHLCAPEARECLPGGHTECAGACDLGEEEELVDIDGLITAINDSDVPTLTRLLADHPSKIHFVESRSAVQLAHKCNDGLVAHFPLSTSVSAALSSNQE